MTIKKDDYTIVQKPVPNWSERRGSQVAAIVDHISQGTLESMHSWFGQTADENARCSSHFGVGKDGRIWQFVDMSKAAWTNGVVNSHDTNLFWLNEAVVVGINPNRLTISIEHEGYSGQTFPESQYQASLWLHKHILKAYPIPVTRLNIVGHFQIDGVNRAQCPGATFPWGRLIADLIMWDALGRENGVAIQTNAVTDGFDPNPASAGGERVFNIQQGSGVWLELKGRGLKAATNEQYYSPNTGQPHGLAQRSFTWAEDGTVLIGFEGLDDSGDPNGHWVVKAFREIGG